MDDSIVPLRVAKLLDKSTEGSDQAADIVLTDRPNVHEYHPGV